MSKNLNAENIESGITKLVESISENNPRGEFVLVGVRSRGDEVAERLLNGLKDKGYDVPMGVIDISLYRDDLSHLKSNPKLQGSEISFSVDDAHVIIVDDVLFTGRTTRAAIDSIMDYGRPAKVELAVLIDRGHRELPFSPDYVGITLETERLDYFDVKLEKTDGVDSVEISEPS